MCLVSARCALAVSLRPTYADIAEYNAKCLHMAPRDVVTSVEEFGSLVSLHCVKAPKVFQAFRCSAKYLMHFFGYGWVSMYQASFSCRNAWTSSNDSSKLKALHVRMNCFFMHFHRIRTIQMAPDSARTPLHLWGAPIFGTTELRRSPIFEMDRQKKWS